MSGLLNNLGAVSGVIGKTVGAGVPADLVAYRASGTSTPSGFSEYTTARGRMICGMPSSGTDGSTVGTALTDEQNKSTTHTHAGASHTHTGPSHRHYTSMIFSTVDIRQNDTLGNTGSNVGGDQTPHVSTFSGTAYGHQYTNYQGTSATGTGGTGTTTTAGVATADVLAYIQLMAIKKD